MSRLAVLLVVALTSCDLFLPDDVERDEVAVVVSGNTTLRVQTSPFSIQSGDLGTVRAADDCAPLAVALRPADDAGERYHRPDAPSEELVWLRSADAVQFSVSPPRFIVALEGSDAPAIVTLRETREGFVAIDAHFPFDDRAIAMVTTCLGLGTDAHVVGGGERFEGVDLNGRVVPLAFAAPGPYESGTNETHAPVPFFVTNFGLAVLVETERPGAFDFGSSQEGAAILRFHGNTLPLRVRAGGMLDNVAAHNRYMGLPPPPPDWALAPQQWRNEHIVELDEDGDVVSTGRDRILEDAAMLRELEIPTTALWIDAPWSTGYNTFEFNEVQFPDPPSMFAALEEDDFRVIVWATEHVNNSDDSDQMFGMPELGSVELFESYRDLEFLVGTNDGGTFEFPWPRGDGGYFDFSSPEARTAFQARLEPLLDLGVRGFKLDYGEAMRPDLLGLVENNIITFANGERAEVMHTRYARLYHETFLEALRARHPRDHFVITRTGGIFDQRNGVTIWPGDLDNDFSRSGIETGSGLRVGGLPAAISGGLSLAMSGYPLYGSDIGGYRGGAPTGEVLLRWAQAASLMPIMQLGGGGTGDTTHNPWDPRYGENAVEIYRRYARLHMDLFPTFKALVHDASTTGRPPIQPLGVFADDEDAWADPDAYVLGDALFAYPVVEPDPQTRLVFLPRGDCFRDFWFPERGAVCGPVTLEIEVPLELMPIALREGQLVAMADPARQSSFDDDQLRILVASIGDDDFVEPGAFSASLRTTDDFTSVVVQTVAGGGRPFALDFRSELSEIFADGDSGVVVESLEAALACTDVVCTFRSPGRTVVKVPAQENVSFVVKRQ